MTAQQIELVKKSWRVFRQLDPVIIGDLFYEKLFTDQPSFEKMFKTERSQQSRKLIDMLTIMVGRIHNFDSIGREISQLGARHVRYGVKPEHYAAVGKALIWTLRQGLGKDWTEELEKAWLALYARVSQVMLEGSKTVVQ